MIPHALRILDVTPAQAGAHHEIIPQPQGGPVVLCDLAALASISGWLPACAGMTPSVLELAR